MGGSTVSGNLLNAVTATGVGSPLIFQGSRNSHTFQVKLGGALAATGVVVTLKGSLDLVNFATIATWDLSKGQVDGDILTAEYPGVIAVKASLDTLSGGTTPTVTANYVGTDS